MVNNQILRQRVAEIQAQGKIDRERWDKERENIQTNFMKELDEDASAGAGANTSKAGSTSQTEKGGSDEDAVLVESGGPASTGSAAVSKGGTKKRKVKK